MATSVIKGSRMVAEKLLHKAEKAYNDHIVQCEKCQEAPNRLLKMCSTGRWLHDKLNEAKEWHREVMVAINHNCLKLLSKASAHSEEKVEQVTW